MPLLDLNGPRFQRTMLALEKNERHALLNTLARLLQMDWPAVHAHPGLNWEEIRTVRGPQGQTLYSMRVTQKIRVIGWREGEVLRLLAVRPDHDGAYS